MRRRYRESWGITGGRRLLDRDELWEIFDEGGSAILPRRGQVRETCPVSTGEGTRRVQLVREEGRGVSSQYGRQGGGGWAPRPGSPRRRPRRGGRRRDGRAADGAGAACPISTG